MSVAPVQQKVQDVIKHYRPARVSILGSMTYQTHADQTSNSLEQPAQMAWKVE